MQFWIFVIGVMALMPTFASAQVFSWRGVGAVELGMTVQEAERSLGTKLGPVADPFSKDCYVTGRADGKEESLSYVVVDGKIAVMTVFRPNEKPPDPNIVDSRGIGIGSTEDDIRRVYGKVRKELAPDFRASEKDLAEFAKERASHGVTEPEPPPQYWIVVENADRKHTLIFHTRNQKVLHFKIGLKPEIRSSEHCI